MVESVVINFYHFFYIFNRPLPRYRTKKKIYFKNRKLTLDEQRERERCFVKSNIVEKSVAKVELTWQNPDNKKTRSGYMENFFVENTVVESGRFAIFLKASVSVKTLMALTGLCKN